MVEWRRCAQDRADTEGPCHADVLLEVANGDLN